MYFQHKDFHQVNSSVKHGFFGSQGGVSKGIYTSLNCGLGSNDHPASVRANRVLALEALGIEETVLHNVHQIHSNKCIEINRLDKADAPTEADALVTDIAGVSLSILTADCTPVLFYGETENKKPVIGAAHAGWKGAIGGVLDSTLQKMKKKGALVESMHAVIGPTIGPESYEVGNEFKDNFLQHDTASETFFIDRKSKIFFDLPSFCASRLRKAGVQNIHLKNLDTFFHEDEFFSYRRSTHRKDKDYGRQISIISIA